MSLFPWRLTAALFALCLLVAACGEAGSEPAKDQGAIATEVARRVQATMTAVQSAQSKAAATAVATPSTALTAKAVPPAESPAARPLAVLPLRLDEVVSGKVQPSLANPRDVLNFPADSGWKYFYLEFAVENKSNGLQLIAFGDGSYDKVLLVMKEGFNYQPLLGTSTDRSIPFSQVNMIARATVEQKPVLIPISLPPGFRVRGVGNDLTVQRANSLGRVSPVNRLAFKVGKDTVPQKLVISPVTIPPMDQAQGFPGSLPIAGFQEPDLSKGPLNPDTVKYPTERPDSEFKNIGDTVEVPDRGSITIEAARKVQRQNATQIELKFRFHNSNKGYTKSFNLVMKFFGDDGILYTEAAEKSQEKVAFRSQPVTWDGYFVSTAEIAPNTDLVTERYVPGAPPTLKGGKLMVSGDMNEIFNVQLTE